jgi:hypothetical protein
MRWSWQEDLSPNLISTDGQPPSDDLLPTSFALLSYCFPPDQMNDGRLEAGDDEIVSSQLKAT